MVKNSPASAGDVGSIPGLGRYPGTENGNPLQNLGWETTWTEKSDVLQSVESQRVRHNFVTKQHLWLAWVLVLAYGL